MTPLSRQQLKPDAADDPSKGQIRQANEALILAAAERVFAGAGFGGATMAAIAQASGLPKANLHYYFGAKQDLYRAVLDLDTGAATCEQLCDVPGDFPVVPPSLVGRPCRFAYLAAVEPDAAGVPTFYGLLKMDLAAAGPGTAVAGLIRHGAGRTGGEASFVPRRGAVAEDDGYLVTYVHDGGSNLSELVVYDARTMAAQPVARVALRRRVPHGFHGAWVTAEQLEAQLDG